MEGETAEGMDIVSSRKEADQLDGEESYRSLFCFGSLEKNEAFKMALAKKPTTTSATCSNSSLDLRVWLLERRAGARIGPRHGMSNTGCSVQQCNDTRQTGFYLQHTSRTRFRRKLLQREIDIEGDLEDKGEETVAHRMMATMENDGVSR